MSLYLLPAPFTLDVAIGHKRIMKTLVRVLDLPWQSKTAAALDMTALSETCHQAEMFEFGLRIHPDNSGLPSHCWAQGKQSNKPA